MIKHPRLTLAHVLAASMLFLVSAAVARADDGPAASPGPVTGGKKTGSFQIHIPQRSKSSGVISVCARLGWGSKAEVEASAAKDGSEVEYNISNEVFEVFVPEEYTGDEPYGLIIWVSPGPSGKPDQRWLDVMRKHKLIWIGANNSGNNRAARVRVSLAIDEADYMRQAYKIDPYRVYVSGASGGGRCASTLAFGFPEIFTGGGYPIIGCNFYRVVEAGIAENGRPEYYQRTMGRPPAKLMQMEMKERRFVLLTGDNDPNRKQTDLNAQAMKKDGFRYVTYLQVPGMGHQPPDAEWFEKGIVALDAPRDEIANAQKQPQPATEDKQPAQASPPKAAPASARASAAQAPAQGDEEADKLMRLARLYLDNRLYTKAREKLNQIVKDHPDSAPATEAKKLLKEIGGK